MKRRKTVRRDEPEKMVMCHAQYDGHCCVCGDPIEIGDSMGWDPATREAYCSICAVTCSPDLLDEL